MNRVGISNGTGNRNEFLNIKVGNGNWNFQFVFAPQNPYFNTFEPFQVIDTTPISNPLGQRNRTKTGQVNPDPPLVGPFVATFVGCFVGSPRLKTRKSAPRGCSHGGSRGRTRGATGGPMRSWVNFRFRLLCVSPTTSSGINLVLQKRGLRQH